MLSDDKRGRQRTVTIKTIRPDLISSENWALDTNAGTFTPTHTDNSGLATFAYTVNARKFWFFLGWDEGKEPTPQEWMQILEERLDYPSVEFRPMRSADPDYDANTVKKVEWYSKAGDFDPVVYQARVSKTEHRRRLTWYMITLEPFQIL